MLPKEDNDLSIPVSYMRCRCYEGKVIQDSKYAKYLVISFAYRL